MFTKKENGEKKVNESILNRGLHIFLVGPTQCLNFVLIVSSVKSTPEICTLHTLVLVVVVN